MTETITATSDQACDLRIGPRQDSNLQPTDYKSKSIRPAGAVQIGSRCSRRRARLLSAVLTGCVTAGGMTKRMTKPQGACSGRAARLELRFGTCLEQLAEQEMHSLLHPIHRLSGRHHPLLLLTPVGCLDSRPETGLQLSYEQPQVIIEHTNTQGGDARRDRVEGGQVGLLWRWPLAGLGPSGCGPVVGVR